MCLCSLAKKGWFAIPGGKAEEGLLDLYVYGPNNPKALWMVEKPWWNSVFGRFILWLDGLQRLIPSDSNPLKSLLLAELVITRINKYRHPMNEKNKTSCIVKQKATSANPYVCL